MHKRSNSFGLTNMVTRPTGALHARLYCYFADCDEKQLQTIERMAQTMRNEVGRWICQQIRMERDQRSLRSERK
jgi:hypothetical protein